MATLAVALAAPASAEIIGGPPTEATMAISGTDSAGSIVSASITLTWLMTGMGMGDLTVAITNTSADGVITSWGMMGGSIAPDPQVAPYTNISVSGTGLNANWRFTNNISGSGQTTNDPFGTGPVNFGTFDFGGDTNSMSPNPPPPAITLGGGFTAAGIQEGATGIFMFTGLSSPLMTAQAFFDAANANADGLVMGFRFQSTPGGESAKIGKPPGDGNGNGNGVPEPASLALLCAGAALLARRRR